VSIDPKRVKPNPAAPPVLVESLQVDGKNIAFVDGSTSGRLPPDHQRLEFRFSGLSFIAPNKVLFQYRLDGIDKDWVAAGSKRTAFYSQLPAGSYRFRVIACNNDGVWNQRGTSLALVILPPWWRTWWAYALYGAAAFAALYGVRRSEMNRMRLENRLEIEHVEAEQLRELDRARSRLFANVSHEFRTPLTLTMGPLDDLRAGLHGPLSPEAGEQVDLARRNAGRVLDLINEILDLARAESGRVTLQARRLDLVTFVRDVTKSSARSVELEAPAEI
jgi:signal transduction histidine kinase